MYSDNTPDASDACAASVYDRDLSVLSINSTRLVPTETPAHCSLNMLGEEPYLQFPGTDDVRNENVISTDVARGSGISGHRS